ncbi:right-handed parallel beta-helix repeat-containing protein [Paenibacillus eucommiae]|uniref:Right handed beta helix domain-containing protein n=1 Tax=Paenibacillus eucommiae TaxID=1355755 RepID=A0ABS4IS37_9BACL|nr:right-handed parallel beta-helix repeat-containing protein [Paenibacillus eucommiae]MBP1990394.1 hypothetical protein [Paenibacillus eucommiae]
MKKKYLTLFSVLLAIPFILFFQKSDFQSTIKNMIQFNGAKAAAAASSVYQLIPADWGVHNDGTHPAETTKGLNDALKWAHDNGKTTFKVPAGTYMISKGTGSGNDKNDRIHMVSDMTFILDDKAIIQKEPNGYPYYVTLFVGVGVKNVMIKGGTYLGDRDTHDYSSGGTHEGGYGILTAGAFNVTIDGIKTEKFTGDGICIGGSGAYGQGIYKDNFESGGINEEGKLVSDSSKIRTKQSWKISDPTFDFTGALIIDNGQKLSNIFDIHFYKADGKFLSSAKNQRQNVYIPIPTGADSIRLVFVGTIQQGNYVELWNRVQSKDIIIQNSESSFNRRQGLTIGGAKNVVVQNNSFHDIGGIGGVAPMAGIDVEGGAGENGYINSEIVIRNNKFYNNSKYDLIFYDGHDGIAEGNHFASKGAIGLAISSPFTNSLIKDNHFDGSGINASHDATFINNRMDNSITLFVGPNLKIDGMIFTDSMFRISSNKAFGVEASNITIYNNNKSHSGMTLDGQPVHLKNITIIGEPLLRALGGSVADGSIFDNLKVIGYNAKYNLSVPRGTYNNCVFEASQSGVGEVAAITSGKFEFNGCKFKTKGTGLAITHADADVTVKNSNFEVLGNASAIHINAAKKIYIENNTITANNITNASTEIIRFNNILDKDKPFDILSAIIRGNIITTNIAAKGISTLYGGKGAPKYEIKNNKLYNAKLQLKADEININNQELTK